jgi:hypothetical protein
MKTWLVNSLQVKPSENGLTNIVKKVHWHRAIWEVVDGKDYYVSKEGVLDLPDADPSLFLDYDSLKPEDVYGWLESILDVAKIDSDLEEEMQAKQNPPLVKLELPWLAKQETVVVENIVI